MKEQIVVTLTSWRARISNIPKVLDSIFAQTIQPDAIVINLAEEEFVGRRIPTEVQAYIDAHDKVQLNWRKHNTKVYKKLLPTLSLYPEALILAIDDDFIYPPTMIADFMKVHKLHHDNPISGNHFYRHGIKCHCGCASMVQAKHLEGWQEYANKPAFRRECMSDDIFYTMLAAKNGYLYYQTEQDYSGSKAINEDLGYSRENKVSLSKSERACYVRMGMQVKHFENPGKPCCVLGAAQTEMGVSIESKMIGWLSPFYDLYVVEHDGSTFEYAAIKFMHDVMTKKNVPCLYLHTKGAYNKRACTIRVRRMWKHEFCTKQSTYFDAVRGDKAIVATPYTGIANVTWFNGWVANAQALREMHLKKTKNRFFYEYDMFTDVDVIGMRLGNIVDTDNKLQTMHKDLIENFG